jgi:hypothetical protein
MVRLEVKIIIYTENSNYTTRSGCDTKEWGMEVIYSYDSVGRVLSFGELKFPNQTLTITGDNFSSKIKGDEKQKMEYLYHVLLIDNDKAVIMDEKVVAKNEESAKFEAEVYTVLKEMGLTLDEVTILCIELGEVKINQE